MLLTLSFSTVIHGMEQEKSSKLKSIKSKIKKKFYRKKEYEPENIVFLKKERERFTNALAFCPQVIIQNAITGQPRNFFFDIDNPTAFNFLQYIFYEKTHGHAPKDLYKNFNEDPGFLDQCQNCLSEGHSALGAAVVSITKASETKYKNANEKKLKILESKRNQIKKLLEWGFEPTLQDLRLSYLELYERTKEDSRRKLTLLLLTDKYENSREPGLPSLSLDIVRKIAGYIMSEDPLLPFTDESNSIFCFKTESENE